MSGPPAVSVIIVSRDRPAALDLCLTGVAQISYPAFEIVVVACPRGVAQVRRRQDSDQIRLVPFDQPNISAARNLGATRAAGEIVAFIDDDAVPEPTWLDHLTAPFADPDVAAAGGYVRGRNGISYQWRARIVNGCGDTLDLPIQGDGPRLVHPDDGWAIKLEGTNMALRRDVLAALGGFDPGFRFYLDESDLNLRLARSGYGTAIAPLAQVHHGFAASVRRGADRTPQDLRDIGASQELFLRKHCHPSERDAAWNRFRADQRRRLLRLMQRGPLDAQDVLRLLRGLDDGRRDGARRGTDPLNALPRATEAFRPMTKVAPEAHLLFGGPHRRRRALRARAASACREGHGVTLVLLSPTALYHRMRFRPEGWWEQTGGLFGRSERSQPLIRFWRLRRRIEAETARLGKLRFPEG